MSMSTVKRSRGHRRHNFRRTCCATSSTLHNEHISDSAARPDWSLGIDNKKFVDVDLATKLCSKLHNACDVSQTSSFILNLSNSAKTRGQSNLTKSASRGAHSPVRGHPRGSKVVPLNSWGRVSY